MTERTAKRSRKALSWSNARPTITSFPIFQLEFQWNCLLNSFGHKLASDWKLTHPETSDAGSVEVLPLLLPPIRQCFHYIQVLFIVSSTILFSQLNKQPHEMATSWHWSRVWSISLPGLVNGSVTNALEIWLVWLWPMNICLLNSCWDIWILPTVQLCPFADCFIIFCCTSWNIYWTFNRF